MFNMVGYSLNLEQYIESVRVGMCFSTQVMYYQVRFFLFGVVCVFAAMKQRRHVLMTILGLERRILIFAAVYAVCYSPLGEDYLMVALLSVSVAHAALRLALLTSLTRTEGSDNISLCGFS